MCGLLLRPLLLAYQVRLATDHVHCGELRGRGNRVRRGVCPKVTFFAMWVTKIVSSIDARSTQNLGLLGGIA